MDMTKCIYNPLHDCEYAECGGCAYYERIKHPEPDPDEVIDILKESMQEV